jgi:hypothetical protein
MKIMSETRQPMARKNELVIQEMPEETLVYDLKTNKAHCLNQTASLVWKNCNGNNEAADIAKILEKELKAPVHEDLVWLAIDQLGKDNLLESQMAIPTANNGLSRREVIRRIGLASVIALPVVASLVAPNAALAAVSCACTSPANCAVPGCPANCNLGVGQCQ